MDRSSLSKWLLIFACWTLFIVLFTAHDYMYATAFGMQSHWRAALAWAISEWYTWAALTPLIVWLGRRYPIEGKTALRATLINVLIAILFATTHVFLQSLWRYLGFVGDGRPRAFSDIVSQALAVRFHINFATCAFVLCCTHAVGYYGRYRDRKIKTSELEAALANARLDALRMQINPHFLFNALNSVSALIDEDPKAANRMLAQLGDFLRLTLRGNGNQESSLEQELQFLKSYLQIEQVRFGDRLKVHIDVDPSALKAAVPNLILQPIVENAFRHAFPNVDRATLEIRGRKVGANLELGVEDNGPGLPPNGASNGLGLANTRARLETQYGQAQSLVMENVSGGGLRVTIRIPFVEAVG